MNTQIESSVLKDYNAGMELNKLFEAHSISRTTLYRILDKNGVKRRRNLEYNPISMEKDYLGMMNLQELCEKHKISNTTLYRIVHEHGWKRQDQKPVDVDEMKKLYTQNKRLSEIGDVFGVSKTKIRNLLELEGVKIRSCGETQRKVLPDSIVDDYRNGMEWKELCSKYGSLSTIWRALKRAKIDFDRKIAFDVQLIVDTYQRLKNATKTAKELGLSVGFVCGTLDGLGIERYAVLQKGESHWNWKGGRSNEISLFRSTPEYYQWRRKVFARDGFRCLWCHSESRNIHAHHIVQLMVDISKGMELGNGITLCMDCHSKINGHEADYADEFLTLVKGRVLDEEKFKFYIYGKIVKPQPCACGCGHLVYPKKGVARMYLVGHANRGRKMPIEERLKHAEWAKPVKANEDEVRRMYLQERLGCEEIAQRLGCSTSLVIRKVRRMGITRSWRDAYINRKERVIQPCLF